MSMYRPIQLGPAPAEQSSPPGDDVPTPTSTNPKLFSRRGRITAIACVPCKKRKSKCNGIRPVCNTCAVKGTSCGYDMGQEHRWQGTLRLNVKKLERELEELKSILPLIATTSEREAATKLAQEIQENGFSEHSAEEVRRLLREQPRHMQSSISASVDEPVIPNYATAEAAWKSEMEQYSMPPAFASFDGVTAINHQHTPEIPHTWQPQGNPICQSDLREQPAWNYGFDGQLNHSTQPTPFPRGSPSAYIPPTRPRSDKSGDAVRYWGPPLDDGRKSAGSETNGQHQHTPGQSMNDPVPQDEKFFTFRSLLAQSKGPVSSVSYTCSAYVDTKRQQLADGVPAATILGPPEVDIHAVLMNTAAVHDSQPASTWASHIVCVLLRDVSLPVRMACAMIVVHMMRWQISPSTENFQRLLDWIKPIPLQRIVPHDIMLDYHCTRPAVRQHLVMHPEEYVPGTFTELLSVNWPYGDVGTFRQDPTTRHYQMNPIFESHIRDLNNWSLSEAAIERMPNLVGKTRLSGTP